MIKHIKQPYCSSLCGQTCIAMLLGINLEKSIEEFNSRGGTRTKQLKEIIRKYGHDCTDKLKVVTKNTVIPEICICKVKWHGTNRSHWVLKHKDKLYDPEMENCANWDDGYLHKPKHHGNWISSYLEIWL